MLEDPFDKVRLRIRGNPLEPLLERCIAYLLHRGNAVKTCQEYVYAGEHFGRWLGRREFSLATVRRFMRRHLPVCRCRVPVMRSMRRNRAALNHLLEMCGLLPVGFEFPSGFIGDLLRRYNEQLVTVRGLAAGTVHHRLVLARTMLTRLRIRRASSLAAWTPARIMRYVSSQAHRYPPSYANNIACAARSLLRFLLQARLIRQDLALAVPTFAHWRLAALPETLRPEEVARLIKVADVRTPIGLRNRAMLLCMAELGMRASDVAGLELDGIDVMARALRLRHRKERKWVVLPMTDRLACAMDAYLRQGRPVCPSRGVFVLHRAPVGKPISPVGICYVLLGLAERAGLRDRIGGTHVLRHSVASRMLSAGASLKQVADLLGHRSIDTTTIYAKVDLKALSQVALPWPGAKEVQR